MGPLSPSLTLGLGNRDNTWYMDTEWSLLYNVFSVSTRTPIRNPFRDRPAPAVAHNTQGAETAAGETARPHTTRRREISRDESLNFFGWKVPLRLALLGAGRHPEALPSDTAGVVFLGQRERRPGNQRLPLMVLLQVAGDRVFRALPAAGPALRHVARRGLLVQGLRYHHFLERVRRPDTRTGMVIILAFHQHLLDRRHGAGRNETIGMALLPADMAQVQPLRQRVRAEPHHIARVLRLRDFDAQQRVPPADDGIAFLVLLERKPEQRRLLDVVEHAVLPHRPALL